MNIAFPLTIYYDHSCPLCRLEITELSALDRHKQFTMIDCSAADFPDVGVPKEQLLKRLHAKDANGQWLVGANAFAQIYAQLNTPLLANLWGSRLTKPIMTALYPLIADNRYWLSKLGVGKLLSLYTHSKRKQLEAQLASKPGYGQDSACANDQCEVKTKGK
jgi:predicted DCC family thiol-disulfide oxidoreductase YuxK